MPTTNEERFLKMLNKMYFDELLKEVLEHPIVKRRIEEIKEETPNISDYEAESEALDDFFGEDYEVIFSINEIYQLILETVKERFEVITCSKKAFILSIDFNLEDFIIEKLGLIRDELEEALKRKHKIGGGSEVHV
jgi:hypothetical protein